ncbi:MAG: hypothetical protein AAFQ14_16340 [Cyanobacteria bacterium J06621_12]
MLAQFPVKTQISLDVLIVVILILLLIIATLIKAISKILVEYKSLLEQVNKPSIPRILSARQYSIQGQPGILCLIDKSELFSPRIYVSRYYEDVDGLEILVGTGIVINVQDNKTIQVFINRTIPEHEDILKRLANNDSQTISRILIKPNIISL